MTKKKAVLIGTILLALFIFVGFFHRQSEIKSYKEWMNLHSFELYKKWSSLEENGVSEYRIMELDIRIYEGIYQEVPNDKKSKQAHQLYVEAMELYKDALEEVKDGQTINTDLISEADEKIDNALDIVND